MKDSGKWKELNAFKVGEDDPGTSLPRFFKHQFHGFP
jgi:hypothetical protein